MISRQTGHIGAAGAVTYGRRADRLGGSIETVPAAALAAADRKNRLLAAIPGSRGAGRQKYAHVECLEEPGHLHDGMMPVIAGIHKFVGKTFDVDAMGVERGSCAEQMVKNV